MNILLVVTLCDYKTLHIIAFSINWNWIQSIPYKHGLGLKLTFICSIHNFASYVYLKHLTTSMMSNTTTGKEEVCGLNPHMPKVHSSLGSNTMTDDGFSYLFFKKKKGLCKHITLNIAASKLMTIISLNILKKFNIYDNFEGYLISCFLCKVLVAIKKCIPCFFFQS